MIKITQMLIALIAASVANTAIAQETVKIGTEAPTVAPRFQIDSKLTREAYQKACDEGDAAQCAALASAFRNGIDGERRDDLARGLYVRACKLDAIVGCNEAGKMATIGKGGERDLVYAIGAFTRGCDAGDKKACVNFAVHKQHGLGLIKDEKVAREAYLRHCREDKIQAACHNLAGMMLKGQGGKQDESGLGLYRANCEDGYQASCVWLKKYTEKQVSEAPK